MFSAILLRVLLSLGLILNGSGYAAAAAKVQMERPAPVADASQARNASPCPEHAGVSAAEGDEAEATHDDHTPECCRSAKCAGACLQHAPAAIVAPWIGPATVAHSDAVREMKAAHAPPTLPRRIRPPIA